MIIHERIKNFDENSVFFFLFLISIINQHDFLRNVALIHRFDVFFIFIAKNTNAVDFFFFFFFFFKI